MNRMKKVFALLVAICLIAVLAMPAFAATENKEVYAGESVTVSFTYKDVYSLDGQFTVSDPKGIVESVDYRVLDWDGIVMGQVNGDKVFMYDTSKPSTTHDVVVGVVVNVKSTAAENDTIQVSFAYHLGLTSDGSKPTVEGSNRGTDTATVKVIKKAEEEPPTQPTTPTTPSQPGTKVDRTELDRQINIAKALEEKDYTAESWATLKDALKNAESRMKSGDQNAVDAAAKQLASAIAALKKVDRTKLQAALDSVKGLGDENFGDLLKQLMDAMYEGEQLMESNDQAAIDAAAAKIADLVEQVRKALEDMKTTETIVQKDPVEVEPTGPYCNVKMHPIWIIIAIVSLIANAAFIVLIVVYVSKKKKNQKDNTPLVDYDISDDA